MFNHYLIDTWHTVYNFDVLLHTVFSQIYCSMSSLLTHGKVTIEREVQEELVVDIIESSFHVCLYSILNFRLIYLILISLTPNRTNSEPPSLDGSLPQGQLV